MRARLVTAVILVSRLSLAAGTGSFGPADPENRARRGGGLRG